MTTTSLSLTTLGTLLLLFASANPAASDSPIRIKTTRTTSVPVRNLSTTRVRVNNAATPTRITAIKEVSNKPTAGQIQRATVQNTAPVVATPNPPKDDNFLPITEVEVRNNSLQQPGKPTTVAPDKLDENTFLILEAPAPESTTDTPQPAGTTSDTFQPEEKQPPEPPALLIGQDTSDESDTEVITPAEPLTSPEAPQAGVLDPLPLAGGAAIQVATMVDPRNCGTPDCEKSATLISAKPISEISLDISPSFKPNLDQKPPKLQQEVRQWRNREGQGVIQGQLADYAFSNIYVKTADGKLVTIPINTLSVDDICYIADAWGFPKQCRIDNSPYEQRAWQALTFHWQASAVAHKPIYFEDAQLERHGHTLGPWLQPMRSGAHFFTNIAILPYHMGIHPWNECQYALGYHRPGSLAPRVKPAFPLSKKAALIQAGSVLGGVFIIP